MKKLLYVIAVVVVVLVVWFMYFTISPLFRSVTLDETLPQSDVGGVPREQIELITAQIIDTPGHPASGIVRVVDVDNTKYLRYENFETINGPDLYVYLAKDLEATEYVNLGVLKATEGNINYEIPEEVEITDWPYVLVWCELFGVLFNYADLREQEPTAPPIM